LAEGISMNSEHASRLLAFDREHVWHPYAPMRGGVDPYLVKSASGVELTLGDGRVVIDGMSSWWCAIHGYNHPVLNDALQRQMGDMAHVMFGGLTHEPGIRLVETLLGIAPAGLEAVFLADSGSVSVEVAIKMALQYWHVSGQPQRRKLISLRNGYHGDTFGAMSVCDPVNGMHHLFSGMLPEQIFLPAPVCRHDDEFSEQDVESLKALLAERDDVAAVILEPLVQGAGGMRFYAPAYLKRVRQLCNEHGLLLIADEIATGFGRTGEWFACEHAGISPDILCIGKALTGGYMTMAATLATREVSDVLSSKGPGALMHGPTFMGNPLACAVSEASVGLLKTEEWRPQVEMLSKAMASGLDPLKSLETVADVRTFGAIGVVELHESLDVAATQAALIERGVWLRPFGKLLYAMPAYVMAPEQIERLVDAMVEVLRLQAAQA
jgi:adenosylmethionine-8-amino-7-oxononanoate aminotransferase